MAAERHLEYLYSRDSYRSWQVHTHYGPLYVAFAKFHFRFMIFYDFRKNMIKDCGYRTPS